MPSPINVVLQGSLNGATTQGALTPIPLAYQLSSQGGSQQVAATINAGETKVVRIPTNASGPTADPDEQTLFMLTCDVANVDIMLNSLGVPVGPFNFKKPNGVMFIPGTINDLPVSDVSIDNVGSQRATISISSVFGS